MNTGKNFEIKIYDELNLNDLKYPDNRFGSLAREYIAPMIKNGISHYIKNGNTKLILVKSGEYLMPATLTNKNQRGSYLFSMYDCFITCLKAELCRSITNKFLLFFVKMILKKMDYLMQLSKFNKTIILNNWLFATNLNQTIPLNELKNIVLGIIEKYPGYTVVVKSLNSVTSISLMKFYKEIGFKFMPSRPIYLLKPSWVKNFSKKVKRESKRDGIFIEKNNLIIKHNIEFNSNEIAHITDLYHRVYTSKYSQYNAQYTTAFFDEMLKKSCFSSMYLIKDGDIKAFSMHFCLDDILSTPLLGYSAEDKNYYRATSYAIQSYAIENKLVDHASSGVGNFKCSRGYRTHTEYTGWYPQSCHSWLNQITWRLLSWLLKNIGVRLSIKYNIL